MISLSAVDENPMLLKKPSFDRLDLDNDKTAYRFGPAIQLAPDHFTKRPTKPGPVHHDGRPQQSQDKSEDHNAGHKFATMVVGNAGNTARTEPRSSNSLNRIGRNSLTSQSFAENVDNRFSEATGPKTAPTMTRAPPFPDSPPKETGSSSTQAPTSHVNSLSPVSPGDGQTWTSKSVPTTANIDRLAMSTERHSSEYTLHRDVPDAAQYGQLSKHDQQLSSGKFGKEKRGHKHQHHPVPSAEGSCGAVGDATDRNRNRMLNRPLREPARGGASNAAYRPRPESRSSNVSKHRPRNESLASSPLLRQQRVNISHEFTNGLATVVNQFTQRQNAALGEQKAKYHNYIRQLKRDLAEGSGVIAQQIAQINTHAEETKDLHMARQQLVSQMKDLESKLGASEERAKRLEEKYHVCKTHLNSAIQEQQDLYTRSKTHWEETIEQVRAMEKSRTSEGEMAVRKAEVIREQMTEKVRQAIAQNKSEVMEQD
ncbi:hypothetical protein BT67DRAFT_286738 [Trichocladium antarcticum]|uniref:Uncharacterized protein n=1 Tax=Trichocladium antarcticum TaxID=1450529 RepID=A0AAN6UNE6_9PEZI|nr:hypothetical protein BT67DRAFT_286738 [Trichocladium antarcticum]